MGSRNIGLRAAALGALGAFGALAACKTESRLAIEQHAPAVRPPGVHADERCWKGAKVTVHHNRSIDAKLLGIAGIAGDAADAQAAFKNAVELWQEAITANPTLKDILKLTYGGATDKYAGDAAGQAKQEDDGRDNEFAFRVRYNAGDGHKHSGDGQNTAATGHKHPDGMPARDGDGWIWKDNEVAGSVLDIDARLAETLLVQDAAKKITEGDITWFTHASSGATKVKLIPWNYDKQPAEAPNINYRPVMVHEIGHLLGLDHCTADDGCEAMIATIEPGQDPQIQGGEMAALEYLYGPGGACGPAQPPPPPDGPPPDGPPGDDAGLDASTPDAGSPDAGWPDAGLPDAGAPDAGAPDAGSPDAPRPDAPQYDAGSPDAPWPDAPQYDAGSPDAPWPDAGAPDAPWPDAGVLGLR